MNSPLNVTIVKSRIEPGEMLRLECLRLAVDGMQIHTANEAVACAEVLEDFCLRGKFSFGPAARERNLRHREVPENVVGAG